jgi:UDP-N-acetyl-D-mannosaminuronic acid transferase (WecB/TagA/CpsF family)
VAGDDFRTVLGIRFFVGTPEDAVALGSRGGLVVVPSAPVLVTMVEDPITREALLQSKLALSDSGLMVLVWNFLKRDHIRRVSGLEYIKLLVEAPGFRAPGASFWIMPNEEALEKTLRWLEQCGDRVTRDACYLAPIYGKGAVNDPELLSLLRARQPKHIVIAVGGGVQERLGAYLQANLDYTPAIHCIGAAIGFLSGAQVRIPMWADHWKLMVRYGERMPDPPAS